jgi:hypothetical protein
MNKRIKTGVVLIILGISILMVGLPFSSVYDKKENIMWNIMRSFVMGEIILRKGVTEYVPDRDEHLYKEFTEYKSKHPEFQNLSEEELINKFYYENYSDKIYRMEFLLKLTKQKAVTLQDKIAIPYRYVSASGVSSMLFGTGIIVLSAKRREKIKG